MEPVGGAGSLPEHLSPSSIGSFQQGMRNSDGKPRNGKYMLKLPVDSQTFENYRVEID